MRQSWPQIDAAVLKRVRRGEREAQESLYRALSPAVYTLCRRMLGSASLAEDALHETFLEVFTKAHGYRGEAAPGAWVRRIAINKCLMHWRSSWVSRRSDFNPGEALVAEQPAHCETSRARLAVALDSLSPIARMVVWMHDVEGYTHMEIGRMTGRTPSFSKSQLARAHERLRALLKDALDESEIPLCPRELKTY
jgi:RNA polymerase sigma factor (sigma-70 family)